MLLRKTVLEYDLRASVKGLLIFLSVVTAINLIPIGTAFFSTGSHMTSTSGVEFIFALFMFISALTDFTEDTHFKNQHGVSRRSLFVCTVCWLLVMSAMASVIMLLWQGLFNWISHLASAQIHMEVTLIFQYIYSSWLSSIGVFPGYLASFVFAWGMLLTAGVLGYFITSLFYRLDKLGKTIFWVGGIGVLLLLPVLDNLTGGQLWRLAEWFGRIFVGSGPVPNPMNGTLVLVLLSVIGLVGCWLLIRRLNLKK
jgi:hypothetical protein